MSDISLVLPQVIPASDLEILRLDGELSTAGIDVHFDFVIESTQLTRVAAIASHLDLALRRATALLGDQPTFDRRSGSIRPVPTTISGLVLESVEIGSTRARARPHGRSKGLAASHPILTGVITLLLGNAIWHFPSHALDGRPQAGPTQKSVLVIPGPPASVVVHDGSQQITIDVTPLVGPDVIVRPSRHAFANNKITVVITTSDGKRSVRITTSLR